MNRGYHIHCLSNASVDVFYNNKLANFTNHLPKNFNLSTRGEGRAWEIGVVALGVDLNLKDTSSFQVVKITSDIISAEPNEKEPILYTTALPVERKGRYFFETVKTVQYFPVRNTDLKTIRIKFLDTDNKILQLQDGQPSIVQFHLRRVASGMAYDTIHLQVDNQLDVLTHPQNTPDNFYVNLKTPVYLNTGAKIALTDISYPNKIDKIPGTIFEEEHTVGGEMDRIFITLRPSECLVTKQMNEQRDIYDRTIHFDLLKYGADQYHFQVKYIGKRTSKERLHVLMPNALKKLFGVEAATDIVIDMNENRTFTAENPATELSNFAVLGAAEREIIVSRTYECGKFRLNRAETNAENEDFFTHSLNKALGRELQRYIRFSVVNHHVVITKTMDERMSSIRVSLQAGLRKLLGIYLNRDIVLAREGEELVGSKRINLYALYPGIMMCYTNFIEQSMIGGEIYPLFRTIPLADRSSRKEEYISTHFDNLEFHKINTSRLDLLQFQFKRINGDFANFTEKDQKLIVNLVIRNPNLDK